MVDVTDIESTQVSGHQHQRIKYHTNLGWCRACADHVASLMTPTFVGAALALTSVDSALVTINYAASFDDTTFDWRQPP